MLDTLILIPARAGSTRIKDKNIKDFDGRPLIANIIEKSLKSNCGRVVVSTDSLEIKRIALEYGAEVPFLRPEEFATSHTSSLIPILHALQWFKKNENWVPKYVITTIATKPFTSTNSIQQCKETLISAPDTINSCTTVCTPHTHPYSIIGIQKNTNKIIDGITFIHNKNNKNVVRSQDYPEVYELVSNCTITKTNFYNNLLIKDNADISKVDFKRILDIDNCVASIVPQIEAIDIDEPKDFDFALKINKSLKPSPLIYHKYIKINQKILLRQLKDNDCHDILEYSKNKEFTKYLGFKNSPRLEDTKSFIKNINNEIKVGNRFYWGIEINKKIVGTIGYLNINKKSKEAELGFGISTMYWGKGIINQCMSFLIHHAFNNLDLNKLTIGTSNKNIRTIEFAKKEGYIFDYKTSTHTYLYLTKDIYKKEFLY